MPAKTTTRTTLAAIIITIAATTAAHAQPARLPPTMLGAWCPASDPPGHDYKRGTDAQAKDDPACIVVTPAEYHGIEDLCRFVDIKRGPLGSYVVKMRCSEGEDAYPTTSSLFQIFDGKLLVNEAQAIGGAR